MANDRSLRWKGKLVEDMSRQELEEAFLFLARRDFERHKPEAIRAYALGRVQMETAHGR